MLAIASFKLAINLMWVSLAIGGLKALIDYIWLSQLAPAWFTNIVMLSTLAFIAFLITKISARKNWARITFLILFVGGTVPTIPLLINEFVRVPVAGMLSLVQIAAQVYALFLLFRKPASDLFRKNESVPS